MGRFYHPKTDKTNVQIAAAVKERAMQQDFQKDMDRYGEVRDETRARYGENK